MSSETRLSPQQERLWSLGAGDDDSPYHAWCLVRIEGELDRRRLESAVGEVVARHEILRTAFHPSPARVPSCEIAREAPVALPFHDLSNGPTESLEGRLSELCSSLAREADELRRAPSLRAVLIGFSTARHGLFLRLPALCGDRPSLVRLAREIAGEYLAESGGPTTDEGHLQYADVAVWLHDLLTSEETADGREYWQEQELSRISSRPLPDLGGAEEAGGESFQPSHLRLAVSPALTAAIQQSCVRYAVAPETFFLAAWEILLFRLSGSTELLVGTAFDGRGLEELSATLGPLTRHLPLIARLHADQRLPERLGQTAEAILEGREWQDYFSWQQLQESGQDDSAWLPLAYEYHEAPESFAAGSVEFRVDRAIAYDERFLVKLVCEGSSSIEVHYDASCLSRATARRWARQLLTLMRGCGARPEATIGALEILSRAERQQLLVEVNDTGSRPPGTDHRVQQLLTSQVVATPDRVAVVAAGHLSYRELDRRADALARRLAARGSGPEVMVGLLVERSVELVIAALGILKSGGAYLPLDPDYPAKRLAFMLRDARVPLLLTECARADALDLPAAHPIEVIYLDEEPIRKVAESKPLPGTAANLAYAIYTSGSTGRPKGVMVPHRSVANFFAGMDARLGKREAATWLAVTSLSFDISVLELFWTLSRGSRVVMQTSGHVAGDALREEIVRQRVSHLQCTPSLARLLLGRDASDGQVAPRRPVNLRQLLIGGEMLPPALARAAVAAIQGEIHNMYGPTETTIWSLTQRVTARNGEVTIGRPIVNTETYLLDRAGSPVPAGVVGELWIGGEGVVRGYLGRPGVSAQRFAPDPFGGLPGCRLYRTGDLARCSPDGVFSCLGRCDHQVKLRGFRIETGEIEAVLEGHPAVSQAVVTLRDDLAREPALVAYVVASSEAPSITELRADLTERLPSYMVPSFFVDLVRLPLTPNKKVDRAALPKPDGRRPELGEMIAPRTPIEEQVATIFAEILGTVRIGVHDSFLALGGHSLLAVQLVGRLEQAFRVTLPLAELFATPTVAGMASLIARQRLSAEGRPEVTLPTVQPAPLERHMPFALTDVQHAYWFGRGTALELGSVSSHIYFEFERADLDLDRLEQAVQRLIARHDMLRAVVLPDGRQQILAEVPEYRIAVLDLRHEDAAAERELLAIRLEMSHQVLPAERWPLFEIRVARLPRGRARLYVSLDLLIADAWSLRILESDLKQLYLDPAAILPTLELSFRDYLQAETQLRESEAYARAQAYWQRRVPTLPPAPELPLAASAGTEVGGEVRQPRFTRRSARLAAGQWRQLQQRASAAGLTPSGVLLAAFGEILSCWSKNPRFTINLTLFNRLPLHPDVHRIVGDFTSLTLLEIDHSKGGSFEERARRLQRQLWDDLDHRWIGGVQVIRELAKAGGQSPRALMPVVFTSVLNLAGEKHTTPPDRPVGPEASEAQSPYGITQTPQVWLDHQVREQNGELRYNWDAVEGLFPDGLLDEMFDAYRGLLARLAIDAEAAAGNAWLAPMRPPIPPGQLIRRTEINATAGEPPRKLLHAEFRQRARRRLEAPAVIFEERTVTHGELLGGAVRLGSQLREAGARSGQLVAVVMEKGWEQVLAVAGILESGAAYLPIDPSLPRLRRDDLLEHGEVELALTQPRFLTGLEWPDGVCPIAVDDRLLVPPPAELSPPIQEPEDLAYVIFTSGSTGRPKGVMIEHQSAWNTVDDVNQRFAVGPGDRVLALSALSFDLSVYDIFGALAAGAAVVIPAPGTERDPGHWVRLIKRHRVSVWNSVPALMELLVEYAAGPGEMDVDSLRLVMWSGDWIPVDLPRRFRRLFAPGKAPRLISLGGATEVSIWSILFPIEEVPADWPSIPYGRPMAHQTFHVLDANLEPRPVWTPGELYIGGRGLARGYWRDGEKTAASFITDRDGERLYRTGDLGRYLPDGNIEFLGREDSQVKIRGHRIELGEVETALVQLPQVRGAAVTPDRARRHLVAYVVRDQERTPPPTAVSADRGATLPNEELAKLELKLSEPGRRRDLAGRPAIDLLHPVADSAFLSPFVSRRSHRQFDSEPLSRDRLESTLAALADLVSPIPTDSPIDILVLVKPGRLKGLEAGIYRFEVADLRLEPISGSARMAPEHQVAANRPIFEQAALAVLFVADPQDLARRFGERAETLSLGAVGAMGQRLMEAGPSHGLGFCPIGTLDFEPLKQAWGLSPSRVLLHHLLGGGIPSRQNELTESPIAVDGLAGQVPEPRPPEAEGVLPAVEASEVFLPGVLSSERLGRFLSCLMQVGLPRLPLPKYCYPSAGDLYPVQTYLFLRSDRIAEIPGGFYYYDAAEHRLLRISADDPRVAEAVVGGLGKATFVLFLVARIQAIEPTYGGLGRPFCQLEAGYMKELLHRHAGVVGVGLNALDGADVGPLDDLLALEPDQILLSASAGGAVSAQALIGTGAEDRGAVTTGAVSARATATSHDDLDASLRTGLRRVLPEYMIPISFVALDALPLTANGKVDRGALADRAARETDRGLSSRADDLAPRSEMERKLASLCREALGLEQIGIHQSFFSLGATSLELVRLHNLLQRQADRQIPIAVLFKNPTIASLSRVLSASPAPKATLFEQAADLAQKQRAALKKQQRKARRQLG